MIEKQRFPHGKGQHGWGQTTHEDLAERNWASTILRSGSGEPSARTGRGFLTPRQTALRDIGRAAGQGVEIQARDAI